MSSIGGVGGFRPPTNFKPPSFEKLDGNSDGALSLDEFKSGGPKGADDKRAEALFKKIDGDGDGSITKTESDSFKAEAEKQFQSFLFNLQGAGSEATRQTEETQDLFDILDTNSDGGIARDEFLAALSERSGTSASEDRSDLLDALFKAIDGDKDGAISREEDESFREQAEQRFNPSARSSLSLQASGAYGVGSLLGGGDASSLLGLARAA
jgi:Ca2+-binding EF-hand superfamily protein